MLYAFLPARIILFVGLFTLFHSSGLTPALPFCLRALLVREFFFFTVGWFPDCTVFKFDLWLVV